MKSRTRVSDSCELIVRNAETGEIKQKVKSFSPRQYVLLNRLKEIVNRVRAQQKSETRKENRS